PGTKPGCTRGVVLGIFREDDIHEYEQIDENAPRHHAGH
ncbi:unnamed protein product, partial [Ectocarpus sp. 6 AP-2014]